MSFGYHFQAPSSTSSSSSSSGFRSRRNPHRPSSSSLKSFQFVRPREELTDSPTVPTFVEKFEAGRSFDVEDDFAFIPELCTEEEVRLISLARGRGGAGRGGEGVGRWAVAGEARWGRRGGGRRGGGRRGRGEREVKERWQEGGRGGGGGEGEGREKLGGERRTESGTAWLTFLHSA